VSFNDVAYAGWSVELAYDASVLSFDGGSAGALCPANLWSNPSAAHVVTGCLALNSTQTGVMDVLSFHCIANGTSPLTLLPPDGAEFGTYMFNRSGTPLPTTVISSSVVCEAGSQVTPVPTPTPTRTPLPAEATQTAAASQTAAARTPVPGTGQATISVLAPSGAQPLETPFEVRDSLTSFLPGASSTWAGWDLDLAYDSNLLVVDDVKSGALCSNVWGSPSSAPAVITGCAFQSSTATGTMDVITFRCVAVGTSQLKLIS
jgi:hypothetical protein